MKTGNLFQQAQLAEASYALLENHAFGNQIQLESILQDEDNFSSNFSATQASEFVKHWRVAHHQPDDPVSGFSATLFESLDNPGEFALGIRGTAGLVDINADVGDIVLDGLAVKQIIDLYNYWQRLRTPDTLQVRLARLIDAPAGLPENQVIDVVEGGGPRRYTVAFEQPGETGLGALPAGLSSINVTGHSLGGHLAMAFTRLFPDVNPTAYVVNAAGLGAGEDNVDDLFDLLAERPTAFEDQSIVNLYGSAGVNFVAQDSDRWYGLQQAGVRNELFTESADWDTTLGHASSEMTDSLAVYDLLIRLSPSLRTATASDALGALRFLFEAASHRASTSLESIVGALHDLFVTPGAATTLATNDREDLYAHLKAIQEGASFQQAAAAGLVEIVPVDSLDAFARSDTTEGLAYRYALEHLVPFAVVGDSAIYAPHNARGELNADRFSDHYLQDRASFLGRLTARNQADGGFVPGSGELFQDAAAGLVTTADVGSLGVPFDEAVQYKFGTDEGETITGGSRADHLYGRDGDDTLDGKGGDDYLEGGAGNDTYIVQSGRGNDVIHDADGIGQIEIHAGASVSVLGGAVDSLPDATNLYEDGDGNRYLQTGNDLHISLALGGELIVRDFDFTTGALGIRLHPVEPSVVETAPPGTPVWQQGPGPTEEDQIAPSVFDPQLTFTPEIIHAQERGLAGPMLDVNAPGQIAGSLWGGLGDSDIRGDDGFNYLVDDVQTTFAFQAGNTSAFDWLRNDPVWDARLRTQLGYFWLGDRAGNDVLRGGDGNDWLESHGGDDRLYGEGGNDVLIDNPGLDFGDDRWLALPGSSSDDYLSGGAGNDVLISLQGEDSLDGGDGDDLLLSGQGDDELSGGAGHDWLLADAAISRDDLVPQADGTYARVIEAADAPTAFGDDTLSGDAGNDRLAGGGGDDWLQGGADDDTLWGDGASWLADTGAVHIAVGDGKLAGNDRLFGEEGNDSLIGGGGSDYLDGGGGDDQLEGDHADLDPLYHGDDALYGGDGDDSLLGNGGNDTLSGEAGNDRLWGEAGDDSLSGGAGTDELIGGTGHDVIFGDAGDDQLFGNEGDDSLLGGAGSDAFDGGEGDDVLSGGSGDDELYGSAGDDVLEGGSGTDLLFGGEGDDVYALSQGSGEDVIIDTMGINTIAFGGGITSESLTLVEVRADDGAYYLAVDYGSSGDRVFIKNGPLGAIRTFEFSDGTTLDFEGLMNDAGLPVNGQGSPGADVITGGNGADRLNGGAGHDQIRGGDQADELLGGAGDDTLDGDAGDDLLDGGTGNDLLRGGIGSDSYVMQWGMGQDTLIETGLDSSVLRLAQGVGLSDLLIRLEQNDLVVQLRGVDEGVRIKDYALSSQAWELRTSDGGSTPVDSLISAPNAEAVGDIASAIEGYETAVRSLYYSTLGARGRVLEDDGRLHGSHTVVSNHGAGSETYTDEFSVVEQIADEAFISRGSAAVTSTRVLADEELISTAGLNADVGQSSIDTSGAVFIPPNTAGVPLRPGSVIVRVLGRPQDLEGNTGAGIGGYSQQIGAWVYQSGVGIAPPGQLGYQQFIHRTYHTDSRLTLEHVVAGASNNEIVTSGHSVVDAGSGNDTVSANYGFMDRWDWRYHESFERNPYRYDGAYDPRNIGALLYGNAGDDLLSGGEANDVLVGGDGDDRLDGHAGEDTYLVLPAEAGIDVIADSGVLGRDPETFSTRYRDWYYQSLGIPDWQAQENAGAALPALPQVPLNDYNTLEQLAVAGVIERDSVEFADGITVDDLTLSWGETVPQREADSIGIEGPFALSGDSLQWMDGGSVHTTLDIMWGAGQGVRVVIPHSSPMNGGSGGFEPVPTDDPVPDEGSQGLDWLLGMGVEQFRFSDSAVLSMEELLDLAPAAPDFDPHERNNQITGTSEDDGLIGWNGDDSIEGGVGNDVIVGGTGDDFLQGGAGSDVFVFNIGDGRDTINDINLPGEGNIIRFGEGIAQTDLTILWSNGELSIEVSSDNDAITLVSSDPLRGNAAQVIETLVFHDGTQVALADLTPPPNSPGEQLTGSSGHDTLTGSEGDDLIDGLAGNDTIDGNDGNDVIIGGSGRDTLNGGAGDDTFIVAGTDGRYDIVNGGAGVDTILGGVGDDTIRLRRFDATHLVEVIDGGPGTNVIAGTRGHDSIDLSTTTVQNIDHIDAGAGNDAVTGTGGGDVIIGGRGRDVLNGGAGDDTFVVAGTDGRYDIFSGGAGVDTILGGLGDDTIRLRRFGPTQSVERIDGGPGTNVIAGTRGRDSIDLSTTTVQNIDHIDAGAGNDTVTGTGSADIIIGGRGRDTLSGGTGDDIYQFARGDGKDRLFDFDNEPNTDMLEFAPGIAHNQLWFRQADNNLELQIIGTNDQVVIRDWYSGVNHQIEEISAGDGYTILNSQIDQLVQAMAAFSPPASGELNLSPDLQIRLDSVLAANWQ